MSEADKWSLVEEQLRNLRFRLTEVDRERYEALAHVAQLESSLVDADFHTGMAMNELRGIEARLTEVARERDRLRSVIEFARSGMSLAMELYLGSETPQDEVQAVPGGAMNRD